MRRSTSCLWAWTQSSRSTPTSSMYNLPFTSRFDKGISVERFTWWNTRWVWLVKSSEFTHIKEGIGSTHQGILRTYTTNFGVINTSSKVEHCWSSRRYNVPKALCIRGRTHKVIENEGHCRIIIQQWIGRSITEPMWVSVPTQRKKECRGIRFKKHLNNLMLKLPRNYDFQTKDQKQTLWSRMDKLKRLSWSINKGLNCREPTHVRNDVWAGR